MDYLIASQAMIVADGFFTRHGRVLRDGLESRRKRNLQRYFDVSYRVFLKHLEALRNSEQPPTAEEERELRFSIDALLDAKRRLRD